MRAAIYRKFGGPEVVRIEEITKPVPKPNEVLIRIHAASVSVADHRVRSMNLPKGLGFMGPLVLGVFGPRKTILGMDCAGVIEAVGAAATRFKVGDAVIALPGAGFGCHAEYRTMPNDGPIAHKPKNLSFVDAATLAFGGQTAVEFLRRAHLKPGSTVLVNGASGAVGSSAIQLAKHHGAVVTAVCSAGNAEMVAALGADHVIDYALQDFATAGVQYDAIVECVGNAPFARVKQAIKPGGALLLVIADLGGMVSAGWHSWRSGKLVTARDYKTNAADLGLLSELAESGALKPVLDRTYPFEQIVEAHRYVDTGRKRGNVIVTMVEEKAA